MQNRPALLVGVSEDANRFLKAAIKRVNPFLPVHTILIGDGTEILESNLGREHPIVVFLSVEEMDRALPVLHLIRSVDRSVLIVAISQYVESGELLNLMRCGVREWLQSPVDDTHLSHCLERLKEDMENMPAPARDIGDLVSFFPAKPGSGASSLMMHAALSITDTTETNIALLDLDLNCGVQAFLWKAEESTSLFDAVQNAERMDDPLWERMIIRRDRLDILGSGTLNPGARLETPQLHRLLGFVENRYRLAFLDHSGNWERYSIDAMQRSSAIFQVCTTDFASLHHARRNIDTFHEMGLGDRVHTILNRASYHSGLDHRSVVSILGTEPVATIPNAFHLLQNSIKEVAPPKPETAFGKSMLSLSKAIQKQVSMDLSLPAAAPAGRRSSWSLNLLRSVVKGLRSNEPSVETVEK
jgi:pilus assembly protein CpaE